MSIGDSVQGVLHQLGFHLSRFPARTAVELRLQALLARQRINCVLDVGANAGQYGARLRQLGYRGRIVSFEPVSSTHAILAERARNDEQWHVSDLALGDADTEEEISVAVDSQLSSLLQVDQDGPDVLRRESARAGTQAVRVRRIDGVWQSCIEGVPAPRVFLKVDTQGFDHRVLSGLGHRVEGVYGVQTEVAVQPLYRDTPLLPERVSQLERMGFQLVELVPILRDGRGWVVELDCLFERRPH